jgi:hypothetical protein
MAVSTCTPTLLADSPLLLSRRCPLARSPTSDVVGSSLAAWSPTPIVLLAATRDGYRCVLADAGLPEHRLGALDPTAAAELHPATVRKLAQAATVEVLTAKTEQRAHLVDAHVEYLHPPLERGRTQRHRVVPGDSEARLPGRGTGRPALPAQVS